MEITIYLITGKQFWFHIPACQVNTYLYFDEGESNPCPEC